MTAVATEPGVAPAADVREQPSRTERYAWLGYLVLGVSITVGSRVVVPRSAVAVDGVITASSVTALIVGLRWHRPAITKVWRRFVLALVLYVAASIVYAAAPAGGEGTVAAAVIHTVGWGVLVSALLIVIAERTPHGDRDGMVDAAIVTVSAAITAWVLVFEPIVTASTVPTEQRVLVLVYPVLALFALPLLIRLATGGGRRVPSLRLLLVALANAAVSDTVYAYLTWRGLSTETLLVAYPLGFLLVGAAVLHPSMADIARPGPASRRPLPGLRFLLLTCAAMTPAVLLWLRWLRGLGSTITAVSIGTMVLFALVGYRLWILVGEVERVTARRGEQRFRALVHHAADVIVVLDDDHRIAFVTPSVQRWGHRAGELTGQPLSQLVDARDAATWMASRGAPDGVGRHAHGRVRTGGGEWREVDAVLSDLSNDADVRGLVLTLHDVTDRNRLQRELVHRAQHDALTGLPNRALFHAQVQRACQSRSHKALGLLFVDVDDFKRFNDSLGHPAGDDILVTIARRLRSAGAATDTVARLGGDEFAVLVTENATPEHCEKLAGTLLRVLELPIRVAGRHVAVQASVGVAVSPPPVDGSRLMRDADTAMYAAKARGKGRLQVFDPDLLRSVRRRQDLLAALPTALEQGQFRLVYQPIVRLDDGRVVAAESLLRWDHPELGAIPPLDFIPLAEESGIIDAIGRWVLEEACRAATEWQEVADAHGSAFALSVNLSVAQLRDPTLVDAVADALRTSRLRPESLVLEVTESMLAGEEITCQLRRLKALGISIAVDDFGTGYSSLRYLQQFPLDVLKVDRSFTEVVADDPTLTRAILGLASSLGLRAVAEGIETEEQIAALRRLGCAYGQGFRFARPEPAESVTALLRHGLGAGVA